MVTLLLIGSDAPDAPADETDAPLWIGILRTAIEAHDGRIERVMENGLCATFADGAQALRAVLAVQETARAESGAQPLWRISVDCCKSSANNGSLDPLFFRAFHLLHAAHPGQVLVTGEGGAALAQSLPVGASLRDLGEHPLTQAGEPEQVFQLIHPQLRFNFPVLRWHQARRDNLPAALSSFVGREEALAEVRERLRAHRLVTLCGPGGAGKTRLALRVASTLVSEFTDGVWLVELAPLPDASLVLKAVATALEIPEQPGQPLRRTVVEAVRPRHLLLILDNCEHVMRSCPRVAEELLRECPDLRILATSREFLGILGESVYQTPALSLPTGGLAADLPPGEQPEAVRLFAERAQAVEPGFRLTEGNLASVEEICRLLDGIPLGIELAAALVRSITPEQILEKMQSPLRLLTTGSRTAAPRQRTLRGAIDWSYHLLLPTERTLLARLSAFSGSFTLEAAEDVCSGGDLLRSELFYSLRQLLDKSMVLLATARSTTDVARYRLLHVLREYARECLQASGEAFQTGLRHAGYYMGMAEAAERDLQGGDQKAVLARLDAEYDNLRGALTWSLDAGEREVALRLGASLGRYWDIRGHFNEGREWLGRALILSPEDGFGAADPLADLRARALNTAGTLARRQSDYPAARALHGDALCILRDLQDQAGVARTLISLGNLAQNDGDYPQARAHYEEARDLLRALKDRAGEAETLFCLGLVARHQGEYGTSRPLYEESLSIRWELGDRTGAALSLGHLGMVAADQGDFANARTFYQEALRHFRELGHRKGIADTLVGLAMVLREQGEYDRARGQCEEALAIRRELRDRRGVAGALSSLGSIASAQGEFERAASLQREALEIMREIDNPRGIADALSGLAGVLRAHGDPETARAQFEESLRLRRTLNDRRGVAATLRHLADLARDGGDLLRAASLLRECLSIRRELGNRAEIAAAVESYTALYAAHAGAAARAGEARREAQKALRLASGAAALREAVGAILPPSQLVEFERLLQPLRDLVAAERAELEAHGRALALDDLCEYAVHGSLPSS